MLSDMGAVELVRTRIAYSETAFAELVLWRTPKPVTGSTHEFKYRLAYVLGSECVIRYDKERAYHFTTPDRLIADFQLDIARWNNENRDA